MNLQGLSARAQKGVAISPVAINYAAGDPELIGEGSYLVNAVGSCNDCHIGPQGQFLAGGTPFGPVSARNLTPDATGMKLSETDFITSMRTGQDFSAADGGTASLIVMPWEHMRWLTLQDLHAIYTYLRAVPPVANTVTVNLVGAPPTTFTGMYFEGAVTRVLPPDVDAVRAPIVNADVQRGLAIRPLAVPSDAQINGMPVDAQTSIGRGAYLVNAAQCGDCHSNGEYTNPGKINTTIYLTGGQTFAVPPGLNAQLGQTLTMSANLIGASGFFNETDATLETFLAIVTSGTHADESTTGAPARALGWPMPWQHFQNLLPEDLADIYAYLHLLATSGPGVTHKQPQDYDRYCTTSAQCDQTNGETCDTTSNECTNTKCVTASDCNACQSCTASGNTRCATPDSDAGTGQACVTGGL